MPTTKQQRIYDLLHQMPSRGEDALKRLIWSELNYDRVAEPLSTREWPAGAREVIAEPPTLLASTHGFDVIHTRLAPEQVGRGFPLSLVAERIVIEQLLLHHPYALFIFSTEDERHWHLVNVKYQRDKETAAAAQPGAAQRVVRRIAVGPRERLRTAAERIAMLDATGLSSSLAIQQRHDEAFDVEAVTRAFFTTYRERFEAAEGLIAGIVDPDALRLFTQRLFNRLLFIAFLERKGWLTFEGRADYLLALWEAHQAAREADSQANFYEERLKTLFFRGLNNPGHRDLMAQGQVLQGLIGDVPYLNGGLFEMTALDEIEGVTVPDAVFAPLFDELLYHYNFTVTESTPLDVEVAVDPEMLGKIFEELVTGRHESGSYYTPKPIVAFMCREALKGHLRDRCPQESAGAVAAFVDGRDAGELRAPEAVLEALRSVRACDPACGSGAYLLGMLHELVELRQALFVTRRLDPRTAYDRKLEVIQRNLYGVDKDAFAVNIARLRLWLSLIVEFEGETPPPLPNLDFKIEVGDSLTAPAPAQLQPDLFHYQLVQDYLRLKGQFMTAHGPEKRALREQIAGVQQEIAEWAGTAGDPGAFDWTVEFAEVFTRLTPSPALPPTSGEGGGFDVIVANPPYVRMELIKEQKPLLKQRYPEVYEGRADLYVYFYARALQLLREGGVGAFISSNKWLRARYGKKLRQHLKTQTTVAAVVDFGDLPVFGAIAYPQVIVFQKAQPPEGHTLRALDVDDLAVVDRLVETVREEAWPQPQASLREAGWSLVKPDIRALMKKLRQSGRPLGEYVNGEIYYGIKTGYNQAFVIGRATRDRLVAEDAKSAEIIKPWLRGRDVKRWQVEDSGQYLIFTYRGVEIDAYPAVKAYLEPMRKRLEQRATSHLHPWYELQQPQTGIYEDFSKPKVVWPDIAPRPTFAFENSGEFIDCTLFTIPVADHYFLGVLNSQVSEFFYLQISSTIQQNFIRFKTQYVSRIPIPEPSADQRAAIEALVRKLLDAAGQGPQVAAWEAELNALVYQVYGLTEEEIALVEKSTQ